MKHLKGIYGLRRSVGSLCKALHNRPYEQFQFMHRNDDKNNCNALQ